METEATVFRTQLSDYNYIINNAFSTRMFVTCSMQIKGNGHCTDERTIPYVCGARSARTWAYIAASCGQVGIGARSARE